ncbi:MAG: threonylcarbamoyl-AMP synthase, partial [Candidatus Electrothrix sp. ATG2]|nr:threonylcarbamoyl-AMP synthase [Candidatus Electrothrix sp. ATG2]
GIRQSPHPFAAALLREFGGPITATSANRSGALPARTAVEIQESLGAAIDLILDGGITPGGSGSTLVGCDQGQQLHCLRAGQVLFEDIMEAAK